MNANQIKNVDAMLELIARIGGVNSEDMEISGITVKTSRGSFRTETFLKVGTNRSFRFQRISK